MDVKLEIEQIELLINGLNTLYLESDLETRKRISPLFNYLGSIAAGCSAEAIKGFEKASIVAMHPENVPLHTKEYVQDRLKRGAVLEDMFVFREGDECWMFKAENFVPGPGIIYIPDTDLNEIPVSTNPQSYEEIDDIVSMCYTGDDFLELCDGDVGLAERLFNAVNWEHPSAALCELDLEGAEEDSNPSAEPGPIDIKAPYFYWLDDNTFCLEFNGGVDKEGDSFIYTCEHHVDERRWIFERRYENDVTDSGLTEDQKQYIIYIMEEQEAKSC